MLMVETSTPLYYIYVCVCMRECETIQTECSVRPPSVSKSLACTGNLGYKHTILAYLQAHESSWLAICRTEIHWQFIDYVISGKD